MTALDPAPGPPRPAARADPLDRAGAPGWLADLERSALAVLPPYVAAYVAASAGDGRCEREGVQAWEALRWRPRVLTDTSATTTATTVLGTPVATPVLVAPMAQQVAAHPDGEAETGRGAAGAGSLLGVSTNTAVPFDRITAAGAPWWYQVYVLRDRDLTARLVERAATAGARALVLTVDTTSLAPLRPDVEPTAWPSGAGRARLTALSADDLAGRDAAATTTARDLDPSVIGWLREVSGLPVVVKGVLRGDDAARCEAAGAAGVIVSTHGGRRLGTSTTSAAALAEVVAALAPGTEVYADSGLRSGAAVAAALALGARAVFLGRPVMWALATGGAPAVGAVVGALTRELAQTLEQVGVSDVAELSPDLLVPRA